MKQADDFCAESDALGSLLVELSDPEFRCRTSFKGWTIEQILRHLHVWNLAAFQSLTDEGAILSFLRGALPAVDSLTLPRFEERFLDGLGGVALFRAWRAFCPELAAAFRDVEPRTRVNWAGPSMSARSSITARFMETWAHGQAIYDEFGVVRSCTDAIQNIVVLGINTYNWAFENRGLAVPAPLPEISLKAPSGAVWRYGDENRRERIEGEAVEFCQVVTQTRNIADTELKVVGANAADWMRIAQCFAGPPVDPPAAGSRWVKRGPRAIA